MSTIKFQERSFMLRARRFKGIFISGNYHFTLAEPQKIDYGPACIFSILKKPVGQQWRLGSNGREGREGEAVASGNSGLNGRTEEPAGGDCKEATYRKILNLK